MSKLPPDERADRPDREAQDAEGEIQEQPQEQTFGERINTVACVQVGAGPRDPDVQRRGNDRSERPQPLPRQSFPLSVKHKVQYLRSMTVCVAALCNNGRGIVTACDTKFSTGDSGAFGYKAHPVHNHWQVMYAADDVTGCTAALDYLARTVDHYPKSHSEMVRLVEASFIKTFHPDVVRTFLLAGFDDREFAHISLIEDTDGGPHHVDATAGGYTAIGSGGNKARFVLSQFEHRITRTLAESVYCVCAAKFFSEDASDVGREMLMYVLQPRGRTTFVPSELVEQLYDIWKREGQLPLPPHAVLRAKELDLA